MKILMVSMSSLHFFRWTEQLRDAGHEVYWFDVLDSKKEVSRIGWVKQIVRWRIRFNYPGRYFVKKKRPRLYKFIQKFNDNDIATVFEKKLLGIRPDVVHSFAMQIACIPVLEVMQRHRDIKWIYSSWGSDVYFSKGLNIDESAVAAVFSRIDFLITDCKRDHRIACKKGFDNTFLGIFPGNGGVDFNAYVLEKDLGKRKTILIKGYNTGVGRGINIIKALSGELISCLGGYEIIIYGADQQVADYVSNNKDLKNLNIKIYLKAKSIPNERLIALMGQSCIHVGNGISDGMPNSLIEAMGMGAFPIQSNPGNATSEIITDGHNGLLIDDPEDPAEIRTLIGRALSDPALVRRAFDYNTGIIRERYQRSLLKPKITAIYESIFKEIF